MNTKKSIQLLNQHTSVTTTNTYRFRINGTTLIHKRRSDGTFETYTKSGGSSTYEENKAISDWFAGIN